MSIDIFPKPQLRLSRTWIRLFPYAILGIVIFSLNSATDLNYIFKGYLVLLESQVGILVIYFLLARRFKKNKRISITN